MRNSYKRKLAGSVGLASLGVAMLVTAAPAFAQDAGSTPGVSNQPSGEQQQATPPAGDSNDIVVTGSRIARRDYQANSPIVTVGQDEFQNRSAISVEQTLNQLPQFTPAGSASVSSSAGTAFTGADQAPGAATLDLRGLGANRTLVLINGRRAQPVNAQLVVDVNTIPPAAIKNVEVITGGAAAVYGADAIAGVVNFILRDNFEGLEIDAQTGISEHGDGENYQINGLVGGNFASGRGNAMLGFSYSDREAAYQYNRKFYTRGWNDPNTTAAGGGLPVTQVVLNGVNYGINPDGSLFNAGDATNPHPLPAGFPASAGAAYEGPLHNLVNGAGFKLNPPSPGSGAQSLGFNDPAALVNIPLSRYDLFGSAHYDITDNIQLFAEGNYTHSWAYAQSFSATAGNIWALTVPYDQANDDPASPTFGANQNNFYPVSAQLASVLNARPAVGGVPGTAQPWTLNRGLNFFGDLNIQTTSDIFQLTAGLRGKVGIKDWTWEFYGSHGSTDVLAQQPQGTFSYAQLQQLVSGIGTGGRSTTIDGPWSQGWTSGATFNPQTCTSGIPFFNANGSVPVAPAGAADGIVVSDDCKNYATLELNNVTKLKQDIVEGTVQGALFDDWAGEVRFAAGATYRHESFSYTPDTGTSGQQAGTGVLGLIALPNPTQGSITAKEVYGELLVPLLRDVPLIKEFDLELGGRYSKYSLSGDIATFKALGDWRVTNWLRFRGGFQRANRAPNIYELFAPVAGGLGLSADPCLNVPGETPSFGNLPSNPNRVNLQEACRALIVRDGGYDYRTLGDDPTAVDQDPSGYYTGTIDQTRLSNFRYKLGYNFPFPYSVALTQGNTALKSEKANTITLGAVINSPFEAALLRRLTLTADYYSIDLKGTIGAPSGSEIYTQCLDPEYNSRLAAAPGTYTGAEMLQGNPFCALINRYPYDLSGVKGGVGSGADRTYKAPFLNQGGTKTSGLDITANWTADFNDLGLPLPGAINLNVSANILFTYKESSFPGAPYVNDKGTLENDAYDYKLFGTVTYMWDKGTIGLRGRYLPSIDPSPFAAPGTFGTGSYTQFDLFGRYNLTGRIELRAGVDNLFNAQPKVVGATATNAALNSTLDVYDSMGRAFYIGIKARI
jgi:outer membrane receptor protein involved in Fe transport